MGRRWRQQLGAAAAGDADRAVPERPSWRLNISSSKTDPIRVIKRGDGEPVFRTATTIALNPYTAEVLQVDRFADKTTGDRILGWIGPLHFGKFAGLPVRLLWFALGLVLAWFQVEDERRSDTWVSFLMLPVRRAVLVATKAGVGIGDLALSARHSIRTRRCLGEKTTTLAKIRI